MYFLTFDGDDKTPVGESLTAATDAFFQAVEDNEWCPGLEDADGVVLIAWDNSSYDRPSDFSVLIGPIEDPNPDPGIDRNWEHSYLSNAPSITGIRPLD